MAQEEPPFTGLVRIRHPQTGALLEEGWQGEGLRQGVWRWYTADGALSGEAEYQDDRLHGTIRWFGPEGRVLAEGRHLLGKRIGAWCWWYPDGALREEATYAEDRLDGPCRTLGPQGQPRAEGRYLRGRREGRWRLYDEGGALVEDANYSRGRRVGELRRRQPDGPLVSSLWEDGAPVLPRRAWERLALRLRRDSGAWRKLDAVTEAVGLEARVPALWALHRQGLLNLGELPELWPALGERWTESLPEEVAALLGRLRTVEPAGVLSRGLHPCWPVALDRLVMPLYAEDPTPFDQAWAGWAAPIRVGFALVLRRFSRVVPADLEGPIALGLAETHLHRGGLDPRQLDVEAARIVEREVGPGDAPPSPALEAWLARLCSPGDWAQACLRVALGGPAPLSPTAAWAAFGVADAAQLGELLAAVRLSAPHAWELHEHLFAVCPVPAEALFGLSRNLRSRREAAADLLWVLAARRAAQAGERPPEGSEEGFGFGCMDRSAGDPAGMTGLGPTLEAVSALGQARGRALVRAALSREWGWDAALPALAVAGDEELYALALRRVLEAPAEGPADARLAALGFASLGPEALPWLAHAFAQARGQAAPPMADGLARAILLVLAEQVRAGVLPDPAWDPFVAFHGLADRSLSDHSFHALIEPALRTVLPALPLERLRAVLEAAMDPRALNPARVLIAAQVRPEPEVLALCLDWLGECAPALSGGGLAWVERAARPLGAAALPHAARAVLLSESEPLRAALGAALGEAALDEALRALGHDPERRDPAEVVRRLAAPLIRPGEPTERVYALRRRVGQPPPPGALGRVGGVPAGLSPERWPEAGGLPMACALTLDLAALPELAGRHPDAAGLVVFLSVALPSAAPALRVLALDAAEAARSRAPDPDAEALEVEPITLPVGVWEATEGPLRALRQALGALEGRVLGRPTGAGAPARRELLAQLDRRLLPLNPHHLGVLYVLGDEVEDRATGD